MADRGLCAVCGGDYAVAQDGTPYKHSSDTEDVCPGSDQQITVLTSDAVWLVYGGDVTDTVGEEQITSYRFSVLGPVDRNDDHPQTHSINWLDEDAPTLALLGVANSTSPEDVNPLLPEGQYLPGSRPEPEPTPDPEPTPEPTQATRRKRS